MTDFTKQSPGLKRRHAAEIRFQWYGRSAIFIALGFLFLMVGSITMNGIGAFTQTKLALEIPLTSEHISVDDLEGANYDALVKLALRNTFPDVTKRRDKRKLYGLVSPYASFQLKDQVLADPTLVGKTTKIWFTASDYVDMYIKGNIDISRDEKTRKLNNAQIGWIDAIQKQGNLEKVFNSAFFLGGDSREPELAGILSAFMGSALSLSVCFLLSFPIGIFAAIYLEEFAPKNRWSGFIEININNLAAVPSIVFGLLGLAIFLNFFGLPRSSPLVGGMVLSLMTLPTIIIASRASLRAVPPSIREAALGIGASPVQAAFHHVVPLALPGMLTGAIIGMARALGDTAPLLMIGMVAFIVDIPTGILDKATALPVQIFLWADSPERAFQEKTSAAILVLLVFLVLMNLVAIILRRKFEQRF
ncbi:MAG: phosphate ABC transporter permease PstA [Rhizobiaceae bacterium]|nr:phosphate ABC transporter permease PstA [Rhizobiaceae bacterium]MBL4695615.1 phosphate ABC transporter permease PstA [Rhizobiaceae bacterium]